MIPTEFKETIKIQEELQDLQEQEELRVFQSENPHLAHYSDKEFNKIQKEIFEESEEYKLKKKIKISYEIEYNELNKSETYFLGCNSKVYISNYEQRLNNFKKEYSDAKEHDFIFDELEMLIHFKPPKFLNTKILKSIKYSIDRIKEFLIEKLGKNFTITFSKDKKGLETLSIKSNLKELSIQKMDNSKIKWNKERSNTDLVELGKALYETGYIENINQKEFLELFFNFFNREVKNPDTTLTKIINRKKDKLILIPILEDKMIKWIDSKNKNDDDY